MILALAFTCVCPALAEGEAASAAEAVEQPTQEPTQEPATEEPTVEPTLEPATEEPTAEPTLEPATAEPTVEPTVEPTLEPSPTPEAVPKIELAAPIMGQSTVLSSTRLKITWGAVPGAQRYEVLRLSLIHIFPRPSSVFLHSPHSF